MTEISIVYDGKEKSISVEQFDNTEPEYALAAQECINAGVTLLMKCGMSEEECIKRIIVALVSHITPTKTNTQ